MEEKHLVIVADGNAAMGPYWSTIVSDYLEKIVRHFCGNKSTGQEQSGAIVQLGLVVFCSHGPCSGCLVRASGWTSDMNRFLEWLSASTFGGGGFNEAAVAEGLAEALVMFPKHSNGSQNHQSILRRRHCILVSASNPFPLSRLVSLPKLEQGEFSSVEIEYRLANAEAVATSFTKCSVSLSVISPRHLPQLRAIYKAGNPSAADTSFNNDKNPYFLVLLSEEFVEARAALNIPDSMSSSSAQSPAKMENDLVFPISGLETELSEDQMLLHQISTKPTSTQQDTPENINTTIVKVEPETITSTELQSALPEHPYGPPHGFSRILPCSRIASPSFTSQEDMEVELNPMRIVSPQNIQPMNLAAANASVLGNLTYPRQVMSSKVETGDSSGGHRTMFDGNQSSPEIIRSPTVESETFLVTPQSEENTTGCVFTSASTNSNSSGKLWNLEPPGIQTMGTGNQSPHQSIVTPAVTTEALAPISAPSRIEGSFTSAISNMSGNLNISQPAGLKMVHTGVQSPQQNMLSTRVVSVPLNGNPQRAQNTTASPFISRATSTSGNLSVPQPFSTLQKPLGVGHSQPCVHQGNFSGAQMEQGGSGNRQNLMSTLGQSSVSSGSVSAVPMAGMPQRVHGRVDSAAVTNALATNTSLSPQVASGQQGQVRYVRAWEGSVCAHVRGDLVSLSRARAYRQISAPETLTADWPPSVLLGRVTPKDTLDNLKNNIRKDILIFDTANNHRIFEQLKERRLCTTIELPSQTLVLTPTHKDCRFIGTLLPGDLPQSSSQISSMQQHPQQQQNGQPKMPGQRIN